MGRSRGREADPRCSSQDDDALPGEIHAHGFPPFQGVGEATSRLFSRGRGTHRSRRNPLSWNSERYSSIVRSRPPATIIKWTSHITGRTEERSMSTTLSKTSRRDPPDIARRQLAKILEHSFSPQSWRTRESM